MDIMAVEIQKFKNRDAAVKYIKFQRDNGNKMAGAVIRMKKYPSHRWANRIGNVATIQTGIDPGGKRYLFTDGHERYDYQEEK